MSEWVSIVTNLDNLESVKKKLCQAQDVVAAYDTTIPPILKSIEKQAGVVEVRVVNPILCGVQHYRAADICCKAYASKYYWCGTALIFVTIPEHKEIIAFTYGKLTEAFNIYWQVHRLEKRYFGRLEYHRKSFMDGMGDEIESIIDSNSKRESLLMPFSQVVNGIEITAPKLFTITQVLKPLYDFIADGYKDISESIGMVSSANRPKYAVDYSNGRIVGKRVYKEVFG